MAAVSAYIIGVILCLFLNGLVIAVYFNKRKKLTIGEIQLVSLAVSDFVQAGTGYVLEIYAYLSGEMLSNLSCQAAGFTVTFFALVSISHLITLSVERYITILHPYKAQIWFDNKLNSLYFIIPAWMYGFFWSIMPTMGWSRYRREISDPHRCSIDLYTYDDQHQSYTYSLIVFCFVVPIFTLLYCQISVYGEVRRMNSRMTRNCGGNSAITRSEREQTFMVVVMIGTFIIAWTPYTICVLWLTINRQIPNNLMQVSAFLAKTSAFYNPIIFALFLKEFRRCLKQLLRISSNQVGDIMFTSKPERDLIKVVYKDTETPIMNSSVRAAFT